MAVLLKMTFNTMIKRIITSSLITTALLCGATTVAFAETSTNTSASVDATVNVKTDGPTPPRPGLPQTIKAKMEQTKEIRAEIKDMRVENRTEIKDMREASSSRKDIMKKKVENRFDIMVLRIGATIEREKTLLDRIVSRVAKIKAAGGNVTDAEKAIEEAKTHLANAIKSFEDLKAGINAHADLNTNALSSTTKATLMNLKKVTMTIEKELRATHQLLEKIVGKLRGMSQAHATTTPKVKNDSMRPAPNTETHTNDETQ
jgi:hypothetical protein